MALLDAVAGLVQAYNVGPLTLYRPGASAQDAYGDFSDGAESVISVDPIAVHTVSGRDLDQLPEADRQRETVQFYATVQLLNRDRIVYRGRTFRLTQAHDYALQGAVWVALGTLEESSA